VLYDAGVPVYTDRVEGTAVWTRVRVWGGETGRPRRWEGSVEMNVRETDMMVR
jgi:hypothetical protein